MVIGATPPPSETSDTAKRAVLVEPAERGGNDGGEESAARGADQSAIGKLEHDEVARLAREDEADAEQRRCDQYYRTGADLVGKRAPAEAGDAHCDEADAHRQRDTGIRPAHLGRDGGLVDGQREHGTHGKAGNDRASRDDDPAVVLFHSIFPPGHSATSTNGAHPFRHGARDFSRPYHLRYASGILMRDELVNCKQ